MPRSRNIKPGIIQNDELASLDPYARIAFPHLWMLADFKGNIEYKPAKLKVQALPYDDVDIEFILSELERGGFIQKYHENGSHYLHICKFEKHQNPHKNEVLRGTNIPTPEEVAERAEAEEKPDVKQELDQGTDQAEKETEQGRHENGSRRADSLIPDSGSLIPDTGEKTCASGDARPAEPPKPEPENLYTDEFNEFWKAYPNKSGKKPAARAFKKLRARRSSRAFLDELIEDVTTRAKSFDWKKNNGQYIPMASTYLNQERWDDPAPVTTSDGVVRHLQNVPASREQRIHEQNVEIGRQWAARRRAQGE